MKRPLHTILRILLVFIPVLLVLAQARAQSDTVYVGQTTVLDVIETPGVSYYWELYDDVNGIDFVTDPGNCPPGEAFFVGGINTGDSVEVMWLVPGTYFFKVTATDSCTNNLKVGKIVVIEALPTAVFLDPEPVCAGDTAVLTLVLTGTAPWSVTFTDGTTSWTIDDIQFSPYPFQLIPTPTVPGNYQYWVSSVTDATGQTDDTPGDPVILTIHPKPVTSPIYRY